MTLKSKCLSLLKVNFPRFMHIYLHSNPLNGETAPNELGDYYKIYITDDFHAETQLKKKKKKVQNSKKRSLFKCLTSQPRSKKELELMCQIQ